MAEIQVGLGERSYPIRIEQGCLARVGEDLARRRFAKRYGVITDDRVEGLYGQQLVRHLAAAGVQAELFAFPHGEVSKHLATIGALASRLAAAGFDRRDGLIAFGGGVVGDITGFLAAIYMRGIPFVQAPTTLLAQVDSSVGGKTGVDIPEGKNLIGAFYQPQAVYIDPEVLATLEPAELLGGLAEVIKYGVIRDPDFFAYLERKREEILALETAAIEETILTCCRIKAEVVEQDEREGGMRRILNFGHTIGHAVEAASGFAISHGHAVAIGMVAAARLAVAKGMLAVAAEQRITALIAAYGLPVAIPADLDRERIRTYLKTDKKAVAGKVFYILPTAIGATSITDAVSERQLDQVL
ncbi:3-dehydroquinate synthase [Desulfoprunum benzoelyticum]|uniref:3-dehydroquinate synthase n=1 Tax=Desulfoprunum benzoelyticum TaxID=1506996 RepID=A0A840ULU9_9BACT|nr:3-dehydroquinate synthase [Desulfoprunum benzoelyticum]MBB5346752.1 3-dehydroquinate synthase [Desulfoprunum benzoelyticum]MBM9529006.1 3-dehydroquinate synthase [Desulfoprunum benzoelyticum]